MKRFVFTAALMLSAAQAQAAQWSGYAYASDPPTMDGVTLVAYDGNGAAHVYVLVLTDPTWKLIQPSFVPADGPVPNLDRTALPITVVGYEDVAGVITVNSITISMPNVILKAP